MSDTTQQALRHFAEHGLRAVPVALENAAMAAAASQGDDLTYWIGIARELDARAATRFEHTLAGTEDRLIG